MQRWGCRYGMSLSPHKNKGCGETRAVLACQWSEVRTRIVPGFESVGFWLLAGQGGVKTSIFRLSCTLNHFLSGKAALWGTREKTKRRPPLSVTSQDFPHVSIVSFFLLPKRELEMSGTREKAAMVRHDAEFVCRLDFNLEMKSREIPWEIPERYWSLETSWGRRNSSSSRITQHNMAYMCHVISLSLF